jgi:hypothetical protein
MSSVHWYATSQIAWNERRGVAWSADSKMSVVHAKRLGTTISGCGLDTTHWFKYWVRFGPLAGRDICAQCASVVRGRPAQRTDKYSALTGA